MNGTDRTLNLLWATLDEKDEEIKKITDASKKLIEVLNKQSQEIKSLTCQIADTKRQVVEDTTPCEVEPDTQEE